MLLERLKPWRAEKTFDCSYRNSGSYEIAKYLRREMSHLVACQQRVHVFNGRNVGIDVHLPLVYLNTTRPCVFAVNCDNWRVCFCLAQTGLLLDGQKDSSCRTGERHANWGQMRHLRAARANLKQNLGKRERAAARAFIPNSTFHFCGGKLVWYFFSSRLLQAY